jgi:hypothetical protein
MTQRGTNISQRLSGIELPGPTFTSAHRLRRNAPKASLAFTWGLEILQIEDMGGITQAPAAGPLRWRRSAFRLMIVLLCGGSVPTLAQQVLPVVQDDIRPGESLQDRFDRRGLIEPIVIGPFQVTALVQGDLGFNDNVFAQAAGQKSDFFFDLGARIRTNY